MNQSARKGVSSDAMTISQSTQRPLDTLLDDVALPGHRLMVQVRLMRQEADGRLRPTTDDTAFELTLCA